MTHLQGRRATPNPFKLKPLRQNQVHWRQGGSDGMLRPEAVARKYTLTRVLDRAKRESAPTCVSGEFNATDLRATIQRLRDALRSGSGIRQIDA